MRVAGWRVLKCGSVLPDTEQQMYFSKLNACVCAETGHLFFARSDYRLRFVLNNGLLAKLKEAGAWQRTIGLGCKARARPRTRHVLEQDKTGGW